PLRARVARDRDRRFDLRRLARARVFSSARGRSRTPTVEHDRSRPDHHDARRTTRRARTLELGRCRHRAHSDRARDADHAGERAMKAVLEFMRHLLYLPPGASSMSDDIDWLHIFVIATTMVVATFVFAAALLFTFRSKRTAPPTQRLAASV